MASHVALCTAHTYNTSIAKSGGKRPSRNPKRIWEENITIILEELARVKSGFKQYGIQPSDRIFAGRRASSADAGLLFSLSRGLFFFVCVCYDRAAYPLQTATQLPSKRRYGE